MKIVIQTNADFTPAGKRSVRLVKTTKAGRKCARHIRWYVGREIYRSLPLTNENIEMSKDWEGVLQKDCRKIAERRIA